MLELLHTAFTLNNQGPISTYWLLPGWLAIGGLLMYGLPKQPVRVNGRIKYCWYWFFAVMLTLPLVLWATFRSGFGDTLSYSLIFQRAPGNFADLGTYFSTNNVDRGFYTMIAIIKMVGINSYLWFFFLVAALQMWCMVYTFRKYAEDFWLCIFLFVASTDYMSWMYNGIRQFIAVCLVFAGFGLMVKKKHLAYVVLVLIASTFHGTALLMLPFGYIMHGPVLNRRTIAAIVSTVILVPFIDNILPMLENVLVDTQYNSIVSSSVWASDDGTNLVRVLVYSVPALLVLIGRRYILRANNQVMNLCANAAILTMSIYLVSSVTSGIFIGRIPIYTTLHGYMALPWLIDQIFEKETARLIKFLMVVFYLAFFVYQMRQWGLL